MEKMIIEDRLDELEETIAMLVYQMGILSNEICTCYKTMTIHIDNFRKFMEESK